MKKIISAFICFSLVLLLFASAHAVTLTCWYSDSTNGCFMNGGAKIKVAGYNTFSLSTLEGYIDYAAGKWTSAGIPAQRVNSSQNISLYDMRETLHIYKPCTLITNQTGEGLPC